jgi:hypothetical protein
MMSLSERVGGQRRLKEFVNMNECKGIKEEYRESSILKKELAVVDRCQ